MHLTLVSQPPIKRRRSGKPGVFPHGFQRDRKVENSEWITDLSGNISSDVDSEQKQERWDWIQGFGFVK